MLGCTETITIVRHIHSRNADQYECEVIVGVSWYGKRGDAPDEHGEAPKMQYAARIPAALVPEKLPKSGDLIVRGILAEYSRAALKDREWFRVSMVGDNRRGRLLPHIVVKNGGVI